MRKPQPGELVYEHRGCLVTASKEKKNLSGARYHLMKADQGAVLKEIGSL